MQQALTLFDQFKASAVWGRYITLQMVEPLLQSLKLGALSVIGNSVQGRPIYAYTIGHGRRRVVAWSQMHGNETTATKALMDVLRFLDSNSAAAEYLRSHFAFSFVPMLNPDGAQAYTRVNANHVDLNRDFNDKTQPETQALYTLIARFAPDFCLNLHDQRSIFGIAETGRPATFSVLAPASDANRTYDDCRKVTADLAARFAQSLEPYLQGGIGRFDDRFNAACAGDHFQSKGVPTVLIETGHYPGDYQREVVRKWLFVSLVTTWSNIAETRLTTQKFEDYLTIPQNSVMFFDFVYKNVRFRCDGKDKIANFAAHYSEVFRNGSVVFEAQMVTLNEPERLGHQTFDAEGAVFTSLSGPVPQAGIRADFNLGSNVKIVNGLPN